MEICAYVTDWKRFTEAVVKNPSISDSDALFRIIDESEPDWIGREPSLESNTSFLYNSEIGSIFVELVDDELLSEAVAKNVGAFLVSFCPQITELDDFSPPKDAPMPDVFYAVISPASLGNLLNIYAGINHKKLMITLDSYLEEQPNDEVSSAEEFMNYLLTWRNAMHDALEREQGVLIFCG